MLTIALHSSVCLYQGEEPVLRKVEDIRDAARTRSRPGVSAETLLATAQRRALPAVLRLDATYP